MRKLPFVLFVLNAMLVNAVLGADLSGNWIYRGKNPRGNFERTMFFKQEGTRLSGHIVSPIGNKEPIFEGKVKGERIEFKVKRRQPGGESFIVIYKGKIQGQTIQGTFLGPGGLDVAWTATRPGKPPKSRD